MEILHIAQIIIALMLIGAVLMQNRGAGLGGVFGGSDNVYASKRGIEKKLHVATIVLSILFFSVSLLVVLY